MTKRHVKYFLTILLIICALALSGCNSTSNELKDGYYTAEDTNPSHGWYEFITIYVNDGTIVSVEYNAKNSSGFIKSWDMDYMRNMNGVSGTYPNEYTRFFSNQLLEKQSVDDIDTLTGATHSYDTFMLLAEAVLEKAKAGDATVALVEVPHGE